MADLQRLFDLADPRIRRIWDEKQTQLSTKLEYAGLGLTDWTAEILNSEFENFTGLGIAEQTGEQEPYNREDIDQAGKVTITPVKFTKAINITEEMLRFNLWPKINNLVGAVSNALNARINLNAAKIHYLGFGTTFFTGSDGQPLYSANHPMLDGTFQSNLLVNNLGQGLPISYDNVKTAIQRMDRFYDDKHIQLLPATRLRMIVAREGKERALEVLHSIGNPDSANRLSNVFSLPGEQSIELKVANWIPRDPAYQYNWFIIDLDRAAFMAFMVWGWRPKFDDDKIVNNGTKIYTGSTMFRPGFQAWQWAIGSPATTI